MSSNIHPPDIDMEKLIAEMGVKAQLIQSQRTGMEFTNVPFEEARETYYSAMRAYLSISKQRKHMNEYIEKTMHELGRIHKENGRDIRGFALKQNPKGMHCTTTNELCTFFIIRKFGGYIGRLYISNEDSVLLEMAANLNLVVSTPELEPANAEVLNHPLTQSSRMKNHKEHMKFKKLSGETVGGTPNEVKELICLSFQADPLHLNVDGLLQIKHFDDCPYAVLS